MSSADNAAQQASEVDALPATDIKFCSIDNPDCEACQ
jgi:ribonucleoside-diphosphate reductase alpha chain